VEYVDIADTNLFLECKRLEDLRWDDLDADPIAVVLTKPVIGEIDKHKRAGGRTRIRDLDISGRIREMLKSGSMEAVIREAGPRVVIRIAPPVKPDLELGNVLDYEQNDDRIVGIVSAMIKEGNDVEVCLLTDDSVAASTAHSLNLPCRLIEEAWKRPPEETTEAKRIKELEKDLATYRAQEPRIVIRNASEKDTSARVVRQVPVALADGDIERMIADLKAKLPMQEEFCAPDAETLADGTEITFEPPDPEEVENYKTDAYPSWIEKCRKVLEELHEGRVEREATVRLAWGIKNEGTRPASQVRVTLKTNGQLMLRRVGKGEDAEEDDTLDTIPSAKPMPRLPEPPVAPQVKRIVKRPSGRATGLDINALGSSAALRPSALERIMPSSSAFSDLQKSLGSPGMSNNISTLFEPDPEFVRIFKDQEWMRKLFLGGLSELEIAASGRNVEQPLIHGPFIPPKHEEEAFYFDDWPPNMPVRIGALTCDLFRHMMGEELFEFEVLFPNDGDVRGAVLCTVHAENLTEPMSLRISVSRTIKEFSLLDQAEAIVADCGK